MSIDTESVYVLSCDGCDVFVAGGYGWTEEQVRECVPDWTFTDDGDYCRACSTKAKETSALREKETVKR